MTREDVTFQSDGDEIAAWLYRGGDVCVVMAHGFSLTRHDGLDTYAEALNNAGATVLVFDHRYLGDSGGEPRQRIRVKEQSEDYRAAIAYARALDRVDPEKIVLWGYSFAGGTSVNVAASDPRIAGAILLCPFLDGRARVLGTTRRTPWVATRVMGRAIRDRLGSSSTIKATGEPGEMAAMSFTGEAAGFAACTSSAWINEASPGAFATIATHRPVTKAKRLGMPVWVGLGEKDITVSGKAIQKLAAKASNAELHRYDIAHFEPFHGKDPALIAADQADWFTRTF
ncbi:pimeloyl-ACP methyl ester carboxylesterase [Aeromicrobium panaciterrae]|uniref:Pimeloyl-ACP methyl ester carboxylesterase n=1 Tax=Aeromicrobium panaciterrae TaxID=363861 RepID=A0ABU1UK04_9ACTN|nr:alpha/beta fold hydrolase [Aeromicrobium panaciterrae]MDR7085507.1 pimeloyl-ACP methyl ester carboxylesterase [Aeromicrobium panaciterrae]